MKNATKASREGAGDVEIDGKYYEVKEKSPLRAGQTYKSSTGELIKSITSIHQFLNDKEEIADFVGSHPKFREALNRQSELLPYKSINSAKDIWNTIMSMANAPGEEAVDSDDGQGQDVKNPNLNTLGAGKN